MTDIKRLDSREPGFREALEQLLTREAEADRRVETAVQEIIAAVRDRGDDAVLEFCMNALRLEEGFSLAAFASHTGLPATAILAACKTAAEDGLLDIDDSRIRCTRQGRRYLNDVLQHFMPASDDDARTG
mgnify:CR=1 FL=1